MKQERENIMIGERHAVYVAGDANIFFPAVVALKSIQDANPNARFDYYMSFDAVDLTAAMRRILDKYGIYFVDTAELYEYGRVDDIESMRERRWPKHVFYNWLFPMWLKDKSYHFTIKADYDLLCVGGYEVEELLPVSGMFAAFQFSLDILREGVTKESAAKFNLPNQGTKSLIPYFNAGFVGINTRRYHEVGAFERFKYIYREIHEGGARVTNAEQAALAILAFEEGSGIKPIPESYNRRITTFPDVDGDGDPLIHNIHYLTHNKPWNKPDFTYLDRYAKIGRTAVYIYRDIWHHYARRVDGYDAFVQAQVNHPLQQLGVMTRVLRAYHM